MQQIVHEYLHEDFTMCVLLSCVLPPKAFSCSEGEFLDMQSQQCQKCAAGTFSLGTGVAFDEWDTLPTGFVTHGVTTNEGNDHTDCSKYGHSQSHFYLFVHLSGLSVFVGLKNLVILIIFSAAQPGYQRVKI